MSAHHHPSCRHLVHHISYQSYDMLCDPTHLECSTEAGVDWRPAGGIPALDLTAGGDVALPTGEQKVQAQHGV
jgi:hypothetical protein